MNNKKLFKGALVLFASILMAVSCSSNSNPNDNNDSNSNNTTKEKVKVELNTPADGTAESTLASEYDGSKFPEVAVVIKGDDAGLITTDSGKTGVLVTVEAVTGVKLNGGKDFSQISGIVKGNVTVAVDANQKKVKLTADASKFAAAGGSGNTIDSSSNGADQKGLLQVTLKFKDQTGAKSDQTLTVYLQLKNEA